MPCWHILAIHEYEEVPLFQKEDCIQRWFRSSSHASDNVESFEGGLSNAIDGVADKDIDEEEETEYNEKVELRAGRYTTAESDSVQL